MYSDELFVFVVVRRTSLLRPTRLRCRRRLLVVAVDISLTASHTVSSPLLPLSTAYDFSFAIIITTKNKLLFICWSAKYCQWRSACLCVCRVRSHVSTRTSAIADGPRDALRQSKSRQLQHIHNKSK